MVSNLIIFFHMIRRQHSDFFERLTQDIAKFFAVLIGKDIDEVEKELDQAYNDWLKLDRKSLDEMNADELLPTLLDEMHLEVDHIEVLAELFAKEGAFYFKENQFFKSKNMISAKFAGIVEVWMLFKIALDDF